MTSVVVLFAYQIKLNILTRKTVTTILPKKLYCYFNLEEISFYKHFKIIRKFYHVPVLKFVHIANGSKF